MGITIAVLFLVWAVPAAMASSDAYQQLSDAAATVSQAGSAGSAASLLGTGSLPALVGRAQAELAAAGKDLGSWWVAPVGALPPAGSALREVRNLVGTASHVLAVVHSALDRIEVVLRSGTRADRVGQLRRVSDISAQAAAALEGLDLGGGSVPVPGFASRRAALVADLSRLHSRLSRLGALTGGLVRLLEGPSTVLLLAANNAEMRSGSGAFLDAGIMTFRSGHAGLGAVTPTANLHPAGPPPALTGNLAARWGWLEPNVEWRNLGLTPDFPTTAALAARMWQARTGTPVDAVISVDTQAVTDLLAATGPVQAGGRRIGASDALQFLLHDQYVGVNSQAADNARSQMLGTLAESVVSAVADRRVPGAELATALERAAAGRHLMLWSAQPALESDWAAGGISGRAGPSDVMVSVINRGANKLDPYLGVSADWSVKPAGPDSAVTLTVTLADRTPAGQGSSIVGNEPGLPVAPGGYTGILSLNLPGAAFAAGIAGHPTLLAAGPEGRQLVLAAPVALQRGRSAAWVAHFLLPGRHGRVEVMPSARIPAEQWAAPGGSFTDATAHSLSW